MRIKHRTALRRKLHGYGGYAQRWKPSPFQLRLAHARRMKLKKLARKLS